MIRTFIALDLPVKLQGSLEALQKELQRTDAPVSWVKPDRIHLTLKFLGDVPPGRIADIQAQLAEIAVHTQPFRLQAAGCGAFPTLQQMRVVWVGLKGDIPSLRDVQQRVEEAMAALDFKREDRPFKAHLTLGRVKGRQRLRVLQEALLARQAFEAEDFDVTELVLYKSELRPERARYTPLFRAAFAQ